MAMVANNYYVLEEYVTNFLRDRLDPSIETVWSDLDIHQITSAFGDEPNVGELYYGPLSSQCFVGMVEESVRRQGIPGAVTQFQQEIAETLLIGHIHYYVPVLAGLTSRLGGTEIDSNRIDNMLTFIIAHERRHGFQPYEWLEENTSAGTALLADASNMALANQYNTGMAESDANAFAFGVIEGRLSMSQANDLSVVTTEMRQIAIERTTMAA